jgi:CHAD domain-containing protein
VDRDVAEEMHQLRIQCKKLRYAAEFFTPLFDGMENFIGHMKGLQDLLGIMNDVAVMQHLLEDLLADTRDPEVLQYAGGLVGWRTRQYHEIKDSFDERWEELLNAKHPWWKR